jgi:hypothetical protein
MLSLQRLKPSAAYGATSFRAGFGMSCFGGTLDSVCGGESSRVLHAFALPNQGLAPLYWLAYAFEYPEKNNIKDSACLIWIPIIQYRRIANLRERV